MEEVKQLITNRNQTLSVFRKAFQRHYEAKSEIDEVYEIDEVKQAETDLNIVSTKLDECLLPVYIRLRQKGYIHRDLDA
ncbi:hypothetical protein J4466_02085 [Candidatus Pacearchaeota archaeon]|nr:hypothetical protein [Candidatus Pacearchaeota archaeon]